MLVALGASLVLALLMWAGSGKNALGGEGRRFSRSEIDRLLDRIGERRPKAVALHPKRP
jgi:hypothetical protein